MQPSLSKAIDGNINGLCWNFANQLGSGKTTNALLAISLAQSVVIARLAGYPPSPPEASFIVSLPIAPLPTGILWNPAATDVICVLSRQKCLVVSGVGTDECRFCMPVAEMLPPSNASSSSSLLSFSSSSSSISSSSLSTGCWSRNGHQLLVACNKIIQAWTWKDIDAIRSDGQGQATARRRTWKGLSEKSGDILALCCFDDDHLVVTTGIPILTSISSDIAEEDLSERVDSDDGLIINPTQPSKHPLFNIHDCYTVSDASGGRLVILNIKNKQWTISFEVTLTGLMSPDLVAVEGKDVVVGGHYSDQLWRYSMEMNDETLTDNKRLKLPLETRVKGICSISGNNSSQFLAILSTFSKSSGLDHHVFLPSSNMITAPCTLNYLDFDSQQIESKQSQDDSKKSLQQPTAKSESKEHRLQEPLQGLTNKGDEESLKSLMRDCIFALRKEGSEISPIAVKSNNAAASDLVETLGALDSLFESCKVTEDQNNLNLEIKDNSARQRMMQSILDNKQKRGLIDLVT